MNKIKQGRFKGQPDWMPDCEIWKDDESIVYKVHEINEYTLFVKNEVPEIIKTKQFEYLYKPVYKHEKRRPDDICVCWQERSMHIAIVWYKDFDVEEWDRAVIMPEELVGKDINYRKEYWENIKAEVLK